MLTLRLSIMKFYQMASEMKHVKWRKNNGYKVAIISQFRASVLTPQFTFSVLDKYLKK
jgi:hypothetical protein